MQAIKFKAGGKIIDGYVLSRDADPRAMVWVIERDNPDRDRFIAPSEIIGE